MDYNARFYSPTLGRFTQPDTIIPSPANPQAWNRYSYVANNPINLNDPTGHVFENNDEGSTCSSSDPECWDWVDDKVGGDGGSSDDNDGNVLTEDQLGDLGFKCGKNVDELVCELYKDPSQFNFTMTVDYGNIGDNEGSIVNFMVALICGNLGQGCVFEGLDYTMGFEVIPFDGGVIWNRSAVTYGISAPMFFASWDVIEMNGEYIAAETFPLGNSIYGEITTSTVFLTPGIDDGALLFTSSTVNFGGGGSFGIPGRIDFRTEQISSNRIKTTGGFTLNNGWNAGTITLIGTLNR